MIDWDAAVGFALSLGGCELASSYGKPAVRISANGRSFLGQGRESATAFCVHLDEDDVAMLIETDPDSFFQTPHYVGWPTVLVRYDSPDPDRVRAVIARAHARAAALPKVRPRARK